MPLLHCSSLQQWTRYVEFTGKIFLKMKKLMMLLVVAMLLLNSCSAPKPELVMMEDLIPNRSGVVDLPQSNLRIRPFDELLIVVSSLEPEATAQYNLPLVNLATAAAIPLQTTPQQQTYIVNAAGDIDFPILGTIHVAGKTTMELAKELTERISRDVTDPLVRVNFVGYAVDVLGEVRTPGRLTVTTERYSILDALAAAGNLTEFGNRKNVMVIRENNGKAEYYVVDLTKSDIMTSPYYYLQQNDVVMVSPTEVRESNARYDTNNSYRVQVISTIVSAASVIASLVIALTVK